MALTGLMKHTVTIQRQTVTKDTSGGATRAFAAVAGKENIRCSVQVASASVREFYLQRKQSVDYTIYFSSDVDLRPVSDLVIWGSKTLLVRGYHENTAGRISGTRIWQADCEEHTNTS